MVCPAQQSLAFAVIVDTEGSAIIDAVEPCFTDTPEMQPSHSVIMQTLHSVRNTISIDLHTIRTPEMQPLCYSINMDTWLGPNSIAAHTKTLS